MSQPNVQQILAEVTLLEGAHDSPRHGLCLMEAVAYVRGIPHTDQPPCVSPVLGAFGRLLNDQLPHDLRQKLKPLIPLLPGTAGDGLDETRGYLALDWLVRVCTPAWLDLAGLREQSAALRELGRIVDLISAEQAGPVARAARAAARVAAQDVSQDVFQAVSQAAAWVAAQVAAQAAAWVAARDAGWVAAQDAGWAALQPTLKQLQRSAIELFISMIHPEVPEIIAHSVEIADFIDEYLAGGAE